MILRSITGLETELPRLMFDNPLVILLSYAAGAAVLSFGLRRFSPAVKRGWRHLFAGIVPLAAVYGGVIAREDRIVLDGGDLLFTGLLMVTGVAASIAATGTLRAPGTPRLEN